MYNLGTFKTFCLFLVFCLSYGLVVLFWSTSVIFEALFSLKVSLIFVEYNVKTTYVCWRSQLKTSKYYVHRI